MKKITFLVLHLGYGGIETSTINTANSLCDKYDIEIMSFYNLDNNQANKLNSKIRVKYLYNGNPNKEEFLKSLHNHKIINTLKEGIKASKILLKKRIKVIKYIKNCKSDYIVSTRCEFSTLLSKYGNNNTVKIAQEHRYHNNDKKYINTIKNKYNNIDYLFALTKCLYNDYKEFLKNNKHTKVELVPNMLYEIPKCNSKLDKKNIITISRLDYGKKNDDIIKSFSKIKESNWKLYIIGDGKEFNNLKKLINDLNLKNKVILTGYKNKEEINKYMLDSSLFLMASITEGLPMVLLEAMSYGIPCIAYEVPSGVNDIIEDGRNGYIIKNRNELEYIKRIEEVINDSKLRNNLGTNAKEKAKEFSKEKIVKIWENILK
ncbi:MAG: glycosyltransferase [Tenericutes bacterium]|nr:glycosyltransferase [Mycoplasmatota bacterium]